MAQLCWGNRFLRDSLAEAEHVGLNVSDLDLALLFENQKETLLN